MRSLRLGAITTTSAALLVTLFRHTAGLAALWSGKTAFLEKCLISSCESKILSAVAASELNIAGHGAPLTVFCQLYHSFCSFFVRFMF
jgi:hypothetical protein